MVFATHCLAADLYRTVKIEYNSLTRESAAPLCEALLKRLNAGKYEAPMACQREFDPRHSYLGTPNWAPLGDHESVQAALALERSWAERGPANEVERRFTNLAAKVHKIDLAGKLRAWQAQFDFANNGEQVRVVLVSRGEYKLDGQCYYDTRFGVLLPNEFRVDERFKNLSPYNGELFFYKNTTYIGVWRNVPSATLNDRIGPPNRYRAYLLAQTIRAPGQYGPASAFDTVCQIGYKRRNVSDGKGR